MSGLYEAKPWSFRTSVSLKFQCNHTVSIIIISVNEIKSQTGRKSLYPSVQEMMPFIILMKMLEEYFILKNGSKNEAWGHYFFHFHFSKNEKNNRRLRTKFLSHDTFTVIMIKINFLSPAVKIKQEKMKQDVVSNSRYLMKFRFILTFPWYKTPRCDKAVIRK